MLTIHQLTGIAHRRRAFTTVECVVVVVIVSLVLAILAPAVQRARESSRRITCAVRLKQIAIAAHNYHGVHQCLPPGSQVIDPYAAPGYTKSFGWTIELLPFLEQRDVHAGFDFDLDCQIHHRSLTRRSLAAFACPSDPLSANLVEWKHPNGPHPIYGEYYRGGWGPTNYLGVSGIGGLYPAYSVSDCDEYANSALSSRTLHSGTFFGNSSVSLGSIADGTSNTYLIAERGIVGRWGKWGGAGDIMKCPFGILDVTIPGVLHEITGGGLRPPGRNDTDRICLWSWHSGVSGVALCDGSVRYLSYSTDHRIQSAFTTRDHGDLAMLGQF